MTVGLLTVTLISDGADQAGTSVSDGTAESIALGMVAGTAVIPIGETGMPPGGDTIGIQDGIIHTGITLGIIRVGADTIRIGHLPLPTDPTDQGTHGPI